MTVPDEAPAPGRQPRDDDEPSRGRGRSLRVEAVLETALYCQDLAAAESFYSDVLGLQLIGADRSRHLFYRCGDGMLLIFNPDATKEGASPSTEQPVGPHGAWGQGHVAFRATDEQINAWKEHLERRGVLIELEIDWEKGGRSIYFRDPAGNSLEFATPELWGLPASRARREESP